MNFPKHLRTPFHRVPPSNSTASGNEKSSTEKIFKKDLVKILPTCIKFLQNTTLINSILISILNFVSTAHLFFQSSVFESTWKSHYSVPTKDCYLDWFFVDVRPQSVTTFLSISLHSSGFSDTEILVPFSSD